MTNQAIANPLYLSLFTFYSHAFTIACTDPVTNSGGIRTIFNGLDEPQRPKAKTNFLGVAKIKFVGMGYRMRDPFGMF